MVVAVEFVTTEVAIVDGEARIEGMGQEEYPGTLVHRFSDILVKQNDTWVIAHIRACPGSTTPVTNPN
ncbi:MAG: hypothetical protein KatS3mg048_4072 [Caldilinea sp.]|nr:MAG: hypothetical protein KatS3mg048_4072 [Caldilinea sp.]